MSHTHSGGGCTGGGPTPAPAPLDAAAAAAAAALRPEPPRRAYCAEEDDSHLVQREAPPPPPTEEALLQAALAALAAPRPAFATAAAAAAAAAALRQPALAPDGLPAAWARAEALYHHIQDNGDAAGCPAAHHSPAQHLTDALAAFRACAALIRAEGLFSPNEAIEDVPTAHLRYLLAEYYIAALLVRGLPGPGRAGALQSARLGFEAFVRTCIALGVVARSEDWGGVLDAEEEEGSGGGGGGGEGGSSGRGGGGSGAAGARPKDGAGQRAAKIERFKRAQAAKKRLGELGALHAAQAARARAGQEGGDDGVGGSASAAGGGVDEEVMREMALLTLASSARSAVEDVAAIDAELPLLAHRARLEAAAAASGGRGGSSSSSSSGGSAGGAGGGAEAAQEWDPRVPPRKAAPPPGDLSVDPARPGIQVTRINPQFEIQEETVKAGIFQSGHLAPTMSMADWGDHVMDLTLERAARDKKQAARRVQSLEELQEQGKEDNEELMDAATMKKRAFEDWADGVPRGSGNTKRI